ncbi:MAG: universal stress protein [Pseudomonadota bacterium]
MTIKSVLCAYSGDPERGSGLEHAIRIAKHYDAHLTGVIRHGRAFIHSQSSVYLPKAVLQQLRDNEQGHIDAVAARFMEITSAAGLSGRADFVDLDPAEHGPLTDFSRAFDLVVSGHHPESEHDANMSSHPDLIALRSGRPVLVVPHGFQSSGLAARAVIAWDGQRAATRALVAAMPVLEDKAQVSLLSVGDAPRNTDRLLTTLERHGLSVDAATVPRQGSVAQTIVAEAKARGARLIVTGAYEHSKFSHDLQGGVTTEILNETDMPVLMAH